MILLCSRLSLNLENNDAVRDFAPTSFGDKISSNFILLSIRIDKSTINYYFSVGISSFFLENE